MVNNPKDQKKRGVGRPRIERTQEDQKKFEEERKEKNRAAAKASHEKAKAERAANIAGPSRPPNRPPSPQPELDTGGLYSAYRLIAPQPGPSLPGPDRPEAAGLSSKRLGKLPAAGTGAQPQPVPPPHPAPIARPPAPQEATLYPFSVNPRRILLQKET